MTNVQAQTSLWDVGEVEFNILRKVIAYTTILHSAFLVYDLYHPAVFLTGDRGLSRYAVILEFLRQDDIVSFLGTHGPIGDYLFHALLYGSFGQYGLIVVQCLLLILSIGALYLLVNRLTRSLLISVLTVLVYVHLPHTLVFPHQLISEAISNPILILSFYYLGDYLLGSRRLVKILLSALLLGVATLIRPISILWPAMVAVIAMCGYLGVKPSRHWFAYVILGMQLPLLWMTFMLLTTGDFSMGTSDHDVPHNLSNRVKRIINTFPLREQEYLTERYVKNSQGKYDELTVGEYLVFARDQPLAYANHLARDLVVFIGKPGISRLTLDYFGNSPDIRQDIQGPPEGWRWHFDKYGLGKTVSIYWEKYPIIVGASIIATFLHIIFMGLVLGGVWCVLKKWNTLEVVERLYYFILFLFPVYLFATYQIVEALQSRYRSPSEFILALVAAVAVSNLVDKRNVLGFRSRVQRGS